MIRAFRSVDVGAGIGDPVSGSLNFLIAAIIDAEQRQVRFRLDQAADGVGQFALRLGRHFDFPPVGAGHLHLFEAAIDGAVHSTFGVL